MPYRIVKENSLISVADTIRDTYNLTEPLMFPDDFSSAIRDGLSLNFNVVGGITEPDNVKENTIWINTDVSFINWYFSSIEPEDKSEGTIWIVLGTESSVEFNALKKNSIVVYPLSVNQYISGEWVQIDAYIYQGSQWKQFSELITELYLYKQGDECTDITGGWNGTKGSNYLSFGGTTSSSSTVVKASTKNSFSCDGYTQLIVEYELTNKHGSSNGNFSFKLTGSSATVTIATSKVTTNERQTVPLDVSNISSAVKFETGAYYATVRIYNVYLLP